MGKHTICGFGARPVPVQRGLFHPDRGGGGEHRPPAAVDDTATVAEGGTLNIAASTLIANDTDAEGATLTVTAVSGATNGAVSLSDDKATATYVHDGSETTSGSFTYTVSDGAATDTGTVTITVTPVNDAPRSPRPSRPSQPRRRRPSPTRPRRSPTRRATR